MKKLLLLAAFGIAGMVSAKDNLMKNIEYKTTAAFGCVPVKYSCGASGYACGDTTQQMVENALAGDALFCGN